MKKAIITVGLVALLFTGCSGGAELSEEDTVRVARYAADLVLKYDSNYKERLLTLEEQQDAKEKLRQAAERDAKLQELLEQKNNMKAEEYSEHKDNGSSASGESVQREEPVVMYAINDVVKTEGFTFENNGYEIVDKYPQTVEEGESVSMELSAATGKKLLLVKYEVMNTTETKAECNMFDKDVSAKVTVNNSVKADSMVTMLLNDFSTLKTEIEPGTPYEAVLVFEIPQEVTDIATLELDMTVEGNTYRIQQ